MQDLGTIYSMLGRIAEAEELLRANLKLRLQAGGESDDKTIEAKAQLALVLGLATCERDTAEKLWREVVDVRRSTLEPSDPGLGEALMGLGGVLLWPQERSTVGSFRRGAEAAALLNEAIRILTANDSTREIGLAIAAFQRAVVVATIGNKTSALSLLKEAHERAKNSLGVDHPMTVFFLMQYGMGLTVLSHGQEARTAYEELFGIYQDRGILFTFPNMEKWATSAFRAMLEEAGELDKFELILQRIWGKQKQIGSFRSRNGIIILTQLILHLKQRQRSAEAGQLLDEYLASSHALDESSRLLDAERIFSVAEALAALGRTDVAVQALEKCVAVLRYEQQHDAPSAIVQYARVGALLLTLEEFSEAETRLREVIPMAQAVGPPAAPDIAVPNLYLAKTIAAQDRPDEARKIFKEAFGLARNRVTNDKAHLSEFLWIASESSSFLAQHGDLPEAERMLDEALETGRRVGGAQGRNNQWLLAITLARGRLHAQLGQTGQARAMFDEIIRATGSIAAHDSRADTLQHAREELAKLP